MFRLIFLFSLYFENGYFCAPPMGSDTYPPLPSIGMASSTSRLHGDLTHIGNVITPGKNQGSVTSTTDLFCYNFDASCAWSNMAGLFVDELDWMQGSSRLDKDRIFQATSTTDLPEPNYAIVATDKVELPETKAVLASKIVECQTGNAELRFKYWTSPGVRIVACTKSVEKPYPNYDYCSQPLETGDPGPAYISIPDLSGVPFQIYIRAENFVFQVGGLQGGFAIIDDIEYFGDFCVGKNPPFMSIPNVGNPLGVAPPLPYLNNEQSDSPATNTSEPVTDLGKLMSISIKPIVLKNKSSWLNHACLTLNCTFSNGSCLDYIKDSSWRLSNHTVGNPLTGIRGDASVLPYNQRGGSFVYVSGPISSAKFVTMKFILSDPVYFMFSYHKVAKNAELILTSKKTNETNEEIIFEAPRLTIQSRRWFREIRELAPGSYDYLMFETKNVSHNEYVGLDEFVLLNQNRRPLCAR